MCALSCSQASVAPTETPPEENRELVQDNDSEQFPEDEMPEEEDEEDEDDEDDEPYEEDYRVSPQISFITPVPDDF